MEKKITVAVAVITYNHEKYIRETLLSIIQQNIDFSMKIIVTNDYSTDQTHSICMELAGKYPELIEYENSPVNRGAMGNWFHTLKKCQDSGAKYIAICEGDDYWIDQEKLKKQVAFLNENKEFSSCFTNFYVNEDNVLTKHNNLFPSEKSVFSIWDILKENMIGTLTVVFRNGSLFPISPYNLPFGDWPLHINNAVRGKTKYLDFRTAAYRVHQNGMWSKKTDQYRIRKVRKIKQWIIINIPRIIFLRSISHYRKKEGGC